MLSQRCVRLGSRLLTTAITIIGLTSAAFAASPPRQKVGALSLWRCTDVAAYCGDLDRPLDPVAPSPAGFLCTSSSTFIATLDPPPLARALERSRG